MWSLVQSILVPFTYIILWYFLQEWKGQWWLQPLPIQQSITEWYIFITFSIIPAQRKYHCANITTPCKWILYNGLIKGALQLWLTLYYVHANSNFQPYNHLKTQKQVIKIMQTNEQHTENKQKDASLKDDKDKTIILKKMKILCSCNTNLMLTIHFVAQKVQENSNYLPVVIRTLQ